MKEAFEKANNKDIKLQAEMPQINNTRKKNKELLAQEKKKLVSYQEIPAKNEKVRIKIDEYLRIIILLFQDIAECQTKITELTESKEQLDKEKTKLLQTLGSETEELQNKLGVLQTNLGELKKVVDETKSSVCVSNIFVKLIRINNIFSILWHNLNWTFIRALKLRKRPF